MKHAICPIDDYCLRCGASAERIVNGDDWNGCIGRYNDRRTHVNELVHKLKLIFLRKLHDS